MTMIFDDNLYAACVAAAGPAPAADHELASWRGRINQLYADLVQDKTELVEHLDLVARIEAPKETRERGYGVVTGQLLSVEESYGRAVLTVEPTSGSTDFGDGGPDTFRTPFINTPKGRLLFDQASSLVGSEVRLWKYPEAHAKKPGQTVRMVARIKPVDHHGATAASVSEIPVAPVDVPVVNEAPVVDDTVAEVAASVQLVPEPTTTDSTPMHVTAAADGTALDDLRDRQPTSIRELRSWATEHLAIDQEQVTVIARQLLKNSPARNERTPAELRTVWRALIAYYISECSEAA